MQFGRCSVRRFFPGALKVLEANRDLFSDFIEHRIRFDQAAEVNSLLTFGVVYADEAVLCSL
jgi:hypothetical protein